MFSRELWFPIARTFPRAPVFIALPENLMLLVERLLGATLVISLILIAFAVRTKIFSITAIASLLLLIFFDQMRLQPWVYQYLLLLVLFALHNRQSDDETETNRTLCLSQIVIAGLYFWSGVQKLNLSFSSETLPFLLAPLQNLFTEIRPPFLLIGLSVALIESLIGVGLLFRKTRNAATYLAIAMHASILGLLMVKGFNSIVWVWNAALILMVTVAFWKSDVQTQAIVVSNTNNLKGKSAQMIVAASLLLPILSFFGWWDLYLSGALYSGNTAVGVIRIDEGVLKKLPPPAQQTVFQTKTGGEQILPLFEWATTDLNVPVYPEQRVFKQIFSVTCKLSNGENNIELIIKERTAIFDGSYKVTRINCAQIQR